MRKSSSSKFNIYCCGLTPYGEPHIGHGRTMLTACLIKRVYCDSGLHARLAINWTDLDPKLGLYTNIMITLRVSRILMNLARSRMIHRINWNVDYEPMVTQHIVNMERDVKKLIRLGLAYKTPEGVKICDDSHALALENGKVFTSGGFFIWRRSKVGYRSKSLGTGMCGWHNECVTMINEIYPNGLDLHLGGADLAFPHHVNEDMIQKKLNDRSISKSWMHIGLVLDSHGEKISKSKGNFKPLVSIGDKEWFLTVLDFLSTGLDKAIRLNSLSQGRIFRWLFPIRPFLMIRPTDELRIKLSSQIIYHRFNFYRVAKCYKDAKRVFLYLIMHYNIFKGYEWIRCWNLTFRMLELRSYLRFLGELCRSDKIRNYLLTSYKLMIFDVQRDDGLLVKPLFE